MNFNYIIAVKSGRHAFLFQPFNQAPTEEFEWNDGDGVKRGYRFFNDLPLNKSNQDQRVNFIEHWEISNKGSDKGLRKTLTYVTNHLIQFSNVIELSQAGRTRYKIENETFNTLKNQQYHFEHNYGQGNKHLSMCLCQFNVVNVFNGSNPRSLLPSLYTRV